MALNFIISTPSKHNNYPLYIRSTVCYYMFRLNQAIVRYYDVNILNCYAYINNIITTAVILIKYEIYSIKIIKYTVIVLKAKNL
jgi:hypothetical protein